MTPQSQIKALLSQLAGRHHWQLLEHSHHSWNHPLPLLRQLSYLRHLQHSLEPPLQQWELVEGQFIEDKVCRFEEVKQVSNGKGVPSQEAGLGVLHLPLHLSHHP